MLKGNVAAVCLRGCVAGCLLPYDCIWNARLSPGGIHYASAPGVPRTAWQGTLPVSGAAAAEAVAAHAVGWGSGSLLRKQPGDLCDFPRGGGRQSTWWGCGLPPGPLCLPPLHRTHPAAAFFWLETLWGCWDAGHPASVSSCGAGLLMAGAEKILAHPP